MVGPNVWGQSWAKRGRGKDGDQAECPLDCCKDFVPYSGSGTNHFERGFPERSDVI